MPDRYRLHRESLADVVGQTGIAVIPAANETVRNNDVTYPFRQDSDFAYLTGFPEPDAVAVLTPGHDDGDYHLFVRPHDRESEIWDGRRAGVEGAVDWFQADAAYPIDDLDSMLSRLMIGREALYYRMGNPRHDDRIVRMLAKARSIAARMGQTVPATIHDVSAVLSDQRLLKNAAELDSIRAAALLSAEGHREAMRFARPGLYEYQVQAAMEYVWREAGSIRNGYPSIVGSGPNATILHYVDNDRLIEDGDLILIDAAAEIDHYCADITRTFPANGVFSPTQRAVYDVVLAAERDGIDAGRPGASIDDIIDVTRRTVTEGLVDLGLIPTSVDQALEMHLYRMFFMHGVGHWLGLDVHDVGPYRSRGVGLPLRPGMVFTVEPGIYVAEDRPVVEFVLHPHDLDAWMDRRLIEGSTAREKERQESQDAPRLDHPIPEEFLGIGVRIEDDILITDDGHVNLSSHVPVEPGKIEALCAEPSWLARE